jgi:hypothetical protein
MQAKQTFRVLRPLIHDGQEYGPAHPDPLRNQVSGPLTIDLFAHEAEPLLASGSIAPMPEA